MKNAEAMKRARAIAAAAAAIIAADEVTPATFASVTAAAADAVAAAADAVAAAETAAETVAAAEAVGVVDAGWLLYYAADAVAAADAANIAAAAAGKLYSTFKNPVTDEQYSNAIDHAEKAREIRDTLEKKAISATLTAAETAAADAVAAADDAESWFSYCEEVDDRLSRGYAVKQATAAAAAAETAAAAVGQYEADFYRYAKKRTATLTGYRYRENMLESLKNTAENAASEAAYHAHDCALFAETAADTAAADTAAVETAAETAADTAAADTAAADTAAETAADTAAADAIAENAWSDFLTRAADTERAETAKRLFAAYMAHTAAKVHISVFEYDGIVWTVKTSRPIVTTCKLSSREGEGYALRFIPSKTLKKQLTEYAEKLCTAAEFAAEFAADGTKNRGEVAEILYKRYHGYVPKKDNSSFWCGCDIAEEHASMKFENASVVNERTAAAAAAADT